MSVAVAAYIFGTVQQPVADAGLSCAARIFVLGVSFGAIGCFWSPSALAVTLLLVLTLEYTRFGAQVRAAVDNQRMARGLGINVDARVRDHLRARQRACRARRRARHRDRRPRSRPSRFTYLVYVLIVVSVGGLGSIGGSFAAAALLGISDIAGKYYVPAARRVPHLSGDGRAADVAPGRPVREALTMAATSSAVAEPHLYLRAQSRWRPIEIAFWLATLLPFLLFPNYLVAGEPDRHHRAVRAVARSDPRLRGHRLARARGVLRPRRLHGRHPLQVRLGRAVASGLARGAAVAGLARLRHELHHRPLPASGADHDHARPRASCCTRRPTARAG